MPVLIVFRRPLEQELGFATLIHYHYPRLHMSTEVYFPPSLGMMPDANEFELNAYQPGNAKSKLPLGIRPFVQQPVMCEALRALVENKNQMIEEATVVPGDCGNFRRAAAGWTERPICTWCTHTEVLFLLLLCSHFSWADQTSSDHSDPENIV